MFASAGEDEDFMNPWATVCNEIMDKKLSEMGGGLHDISVGEWAGLVGGKKEVSIMANIKLVFFVPIFLSNVPPTTPLYVNVHSLKLHTLLRIQMLLIDP